MIDWNFSLGRIGILVGLLVGFWLLGGLEFPIPSEGSSLNPHRISKAWLYSVLMFGVGAVCVSVLDHWAGNVERTNIRPAWIILGVLLMGSGLFWQSVMRASLN